MADRRDASACRSCHVVLSGVSNRNDLYRPSQSGIKLGDFRRLYRDEPHGVKDRPQIVNHGTYQAACSGWHSRTRSLGATSPRGGRRLPIVQLLGGTAKLGDFHDIKCRLEVQSNNRNIASCPYQSTNFEIAEDRSRRLFQDGRLLANINSSQTNCPGITDSSPWTQDESDRRGFLTSDERCSTTVNHLISATVEEGGHDHEGGTPRQESTSINSASDKDSKKASGIETLLSYQMSRHGPVFPILAEKRSLEQRHELLLLQLTTLRMDDADLARQHGRIARNGVHVFLDMSNINISFYQALRNKYSIQGPARFMPLPQLNLHFLTEILVRDRKIMTLNAGCSTLPYRQEPKYVRELRRLGYHVDLRERKRVGQMPNWNRTDSGVGNTSSSDEIANSGITAQYTEDLVDETLQTRIAESVMEFFENQGTLVIATGDAQPARYSDGFLAYAKRALRMGWHVEVVSWKMSLSSHWKKLERHPDWGKCFRVTKLDEYLENLLI